MPPARERIVAGGADFDERSVVLRPSRTRRRARTLQSRPAAARAGAARLPEGCGAREALHCSLSPRSRAKNAACVTSGTPSVQLHLVGVSEDLVLVVVVGNIDQSDGHVGGVEEARPRACLQRSMYGLPPPLTKVGWDLPSA
jgi:hypothetical protein